jgi:Domain of unknown function (DUF4340)
MMRGGKSFIVLLVVLLGLGSYVYFVESKRPADEGDKKDKVFTVEASAITEMTVKAEDGETTKLQKDGDDWKIVAPMAGKPDSSQVSGLTSNLASLEVQRVIDDNPPDLAEYGLADPRVTVSFKAGGQDHELLIGRKTPPATDYYAKLAGQPRVFLISSFLDSTFNRTTFDLRDKAALAVNRDEIDALTVTTPERTLRFAKNGNEWRLAQPVVARGDFSAIEGLVSRISTLQMTSIAAEKVDKPAEYGLDKPAATVTIGNKSSQATLEIGRSPEAGKLYARDASRPMVFTIDASLMDDLKKAPSDYRQKDLFDARAFNTNRIDVTRDGQTWTFEKSTAKNADGQDEEAWKQTAPAQKDEDREKISEFLSAVTLVRAESFADKAPATVLKNPELSITITSDEGKRKETVRFDRSGSDAWADRDGEPGAARVPASAVDEILKAFEELK